jgi:hypothetical protein
MKPQPTLKGYDAWVVDQLVKAKGITQAEVVAWICDRWVDSNRGFLEEEFGITRAQYKSEPAKSGTVVEYRTSRGPESG